MSDAKLSVNIGTSNKSREIWYDYLKSLYSVISQFVQLEYEGETVDIDGFLVLPKEFYQPDDSTTSQKANRWQYLRFISQYEPDLLGNLSLY